MVSAVWSVQYGQYDACVVCLCAAWHNDIDRHVSTCTYAVYSKIGPLQTQFQLKHPNIGRELAQRYLYDI